jgi:predicted acyltransferase
MANSPIPAASGPSSRLASLDALRGFDLFWICGADAFGHAFLTAANGPVSHAIADQLEHVAWQGFRFYDLIFPLFVFISGISIVLSRSAKPEAGDRGHAFAQGDFEARIQGLHVGRAAFGARVGHL